MGRVSDAMRRAGHGGEVPPAAGDDGPFTEGEEAAATAADASSADGEHVSSPGALMRGSRAVVPVQVLRNNPDGEIRFIDALGALSRRRWIVVGVIVAAMIVAVTYNKLATPIYEAQARLLVEPNSPDVVPFRGVTEDQGRVDYYATQLEILKSRALARRTLEKLNMLDSDPQRQAGQIGSLLGHLVVAPVQSPLGDSRVISVTVNSTDPELAAKFANGVSRTYVDQNLESRRQGSRDASEWLKQRLDELRADVAKREAALQNYRERQGSVSLGEDHNITTQKLDQLNTLVTTARTELVEKKALYDQLKSIEAQGQPLDTFTPILTNGFIQGLKADLATLQREREQLSERLGELHPDMVKVTAAIATAKARLDAEMAKVVSGVENDYKAAAAKEHVLNESLEAQKREVLELNQASIGYTTLKRDSSSTEQMLQTVLQRFKETDLSAELQTNNARVLDLAEVPRGFIWPRAQLNLILALFGGTFLGVALAFGLEYLDPRIAMASDIAASLGLPLLGVTPRIRGLKQRIAHDRLPPSFQEALRSIRTQLYLSPIPGAARSVTVTSTSAGEGKTIVATNLAISIAMSGRRVLLVDADLRRPQLHEIFGVSRAPGLADVMAGDIKPTEALLEGPIKGLFLLPAGGKVTNPTDLLDSGHLRHLIRAFTHVFDTVILDCTPIMGVADASIVANTSSSVLMVIGSGRTSPEAAQAALDRIAAVQAQVVGVVLNRAKVDVREAYGYSATELAS